MEIALIILIIAWIAGWFEDPEKKAKRLEKAKYESVHRYDTLQG